MRVLVTSNSGWSYAKQVCTEPGDVIVVVTKKAKDPDLVYEIDDRGKLRGPTNR